MRSDVDDDERGSVLPRSLEDFRQTRGLRGDHGRGVSLPKIMPALGACLGINVDHRALVAGAHRCNVKTVASSWRTMIRIAAIRRYWSCLQRFHRVESRFIKQHRWKSRTNK